MTAIITRNQHGGYSIVPPNAKRVGNYATAEDAAQVAIKNGWQVRSGGITESERRRLRPVLSHAEVEGPIYRNHFQRGVNVLRKIVTKGAE